MGREFDEEVTLLAGQAPEPGAFCAEDESNFPGQCGLAEVFFGFPGETNPEIADICHSFQCPGQIGDPNDRDMFNRARGGLGQRSGYLRGMTILNNNSSCPEGCSASDNCANIVRVRDLIEEEQGRSLAFTQWRYNIFDTEVGQWGNMKGQSLMDSALR